MNTKITEKQLDIIESMISKNKSESEITNWVESQSNSLNIFEYFNKIMQGYISKPKK